MTSLYIGLTGSHAERLPRAWWNNPNAFPVRYLYLDLSGTGTAADEAGTEGEAGDAEEFRFRFKTPEHVTAENESGKAFWFRVSEIFDMHEAFDVVTWLQDRERANDKAAARALHRLFKVVHDETVVNYFLEEGQSIDKVLNIFIRVNHQGVPLSFSDLLLSFATAKWTKRDARKEIYELVDRLNGIGHGFSFSKDLVMKSALVLTDAPSIRFQVSSFDQAQMAKIEDEWPRIVQALETGTGLLADFGLSSGSLVANSALIPVAYYVKVRGLTDAYRTSQGESGDRLALREWVLGALLKQGVWGSGLDTLLTNLRAALRDHGPSGFPTAEIRAAMAKSGKNLDFTPGDIESFADLEYGEKRAFSVLTLLYPFVDTRNQFHVDHVFPRSLLSAKSLKFAGVDEPDVQATIAKAVNRLGNLQLLEGPHNLSKSDMAPMKWLAQRFPDVEQRRAWAAIYDLGALSDDPSKFLAFYDDRRTRLIGRLSTLLGVPAAEPTTAEGTVAAQS